MSLYLIAYDLQQHPASALENLVKSLEDAHAFRALPGVWFLNSPYSAQQNYDWFAAHTHVGDSLMVISVDPGGSRNSVTSGSPAASAFDDAMSQLLLRNAFGQS